MPGTEQRSTDVKERKGEVDRGMGTLVIEKRDEKTKFCRRSEKSACLKNEKKGRKQTVLKMIEMGGEADGHSEGMVPTFRGSAGMNWEGFGEIGRGGINSIPFNEGKGAREEGRGATKRKESFSI